MNDVIISRVKSTVCVTCLSSDRTLYPVRDLNNEFHHFFGIQLSDRKDKMCWECKAMVTKFEVFKNKALKAQTILREISKDGKYEILKSLSQLKLTTTTAASIKYIPIKKTLELPIEHKDGIQKKNVELKEVFIDVDNVKTEETEDHGSHDRDSIDEDLFQREEENIAMKSEKVFTDMDNVKTEEAEDHDFHDRNSIDEDLYHREKEKNIKKKSKAADKDYIPSTKIKEDRRKLKMYTITALNEEEMQKAREDKRRSRSYLMSGCRCETCLETFNKQKLFEEHMVKHEKHSGHLSCRICKQRFSLENDLELHEESHYTCYECRVCGHRSNRVESVLYHYNKEHAIRDTTCSVCGLRFTNPYKYKLHRRSAHKQRTCEQCGKECSSPFSLKRHLLQHTETPTFKCKLCDKEYRRKWGLTSHIMHVHDDKINEAAFCVECGVQFKTVYSYRVHLKTTLKHVAEDMKHKCPHCEKSFMSRAYLKCHIDSMHTKSYNYDCKICNAMFKNTTRLRIHVREKHEGKPRPKNKVCDICSKAFNTSRILMNHIRTHSGERPFECELCEAKFTQKVALNSHIKYIHLKNKRHKSQDF